MLDSFIPYFFFHSKRKRNLGIILSDRNQLFELILIISIMVMSVGTCHGDDVNNVDSCEKQESNSAEMGTVVPSFASITMELAATHKTLADQLFLLDQDRAVSTREYCLAENLVNQIDQPTLATLNPADRELLNLLKADIQYRKSLIQGGATFWGLQGARLAPPLKQLAAFRSDLKEYNNLVDEINSRFGINTNTKSKLKDIAANEVTDRLNKYVASQDEEIKTIEVDRFISIKREADARITRIAGEIERVEGEAKNLSKQAEDLNASIGKAIINSAASAAGVPPGVLNGIQQGNLTNVVKSVATQVLANPAIMNQPEIASAISDFKTRAPQIGEMIEKYNSAVDKVNYAKEKIQAIKYGIDATNKIIRDPSFDNFVTLGNVSWSMLPADKQSSLIKGIEQSKPVGVLVQIATDTKTTTAELQGMLKNAQDVISTAIANTDQDGKRLALEASKYVDAIATANGNNWEQVSSFYQRTFSEIVTNLNLFPEISANLLKELVNFVPQSFVDWLEQNNRNAFNSLLIANKLRTKEEMVARLRKDGLDALSHLQVETIAQSGGGEDGIYFVKNGQRTLFGEIPNAFKFLAPYLGIQGDTEKLVESLKNSYAMIARQGPDARKRLTVEFLNNAPTMVLRLVNEGTLIIDAASDRDRQVAQNFRDMLWDQSLKRMNASELNKLSTIAAKISVGTTVASEATLNAANPDTAWSSDSIDSATVFGSQSIQGDRRLRGASQDNAAVKAIVTASLDAAFPGAGAAIGVVSSMFELNKMWDRLNDLFDDEKRLLAEQNQLIAASQAAEIDSAISKKELAIAEARKQAATKQIELWNEATENMLGTLCQNRAQIRARRPLVFFTGEELRRHFDLFNRSMASWTGIGLEGETFLEKYVKTNPQYLRFAIDPDIQVYGWLNRENDGARVDLDLVAQRWKQKRKLLENVCSDGNIQCIPGMGSIMEMNQGSSFLTNHLTSSDRAVFQKILSTKREQKEFRFAMSPYSEPLRAEDRNVRLLDIHLNWVTGTRKTIPGNVQGVEVIHPGVGTIISNGRNGISLRHEVLARQSQTSFNKSGSFEDLSAEFVATQAIPDEQLQRLPLPRFYGYSPITSWTIKINSDYIPPNAEDLQIHMAYVYQRDGGLATESDYVEYLKGRSVEDTYTEIDVTRQKVRQEFPVPWYKFVAYRITNGEEFGWITPIGGSLSAQDVLLRANMEPTQMKKKMSDKQSAGYCEGEPQSVDLKSNKTIGVTAVCLSRSKIFQELSHHLLTQGTQPDGMPLTKLQATEKSLEYIKLLDDSKLCECSGNVSPGQACAVQGFL